MLHAIRGTRIGAIINKNDQPMKIKWHLLLLFAGILMSHHSMAQDQSTPTQKLEVEASFPGGQQAWNKYISKQLSLHVDEFKKKDVGTCIIKFMVDTKGRPQDVQATNMKKTKLAQVAIEAIEYGPKWIPAQQDGKFVNAYRVQPVTLQNSK